MQRINQAISTNEYAGIYLLYGEEDYLRKQFRDKLKNALTGGDLSMNYTYQEGKDVNVAQLIDLAETMPFFADRRVIVIENSGLFKKGGEQMAEYLEDRCETTYFVFVEQDVDSRCKLFKKVKEKGVAVEFGRMDDQSLKKWAGARLKAAGLQISLRDMDYFLSKTGTDMMILTQELEKLICYCMGRNAVTQEDIDAICTTRVEDKIFDLLDAMASGKQKQAMAQYRNLLFAKEPPLKILILLSKQFANMLQAKDLKSRGLDNRSVAQAMGTAPFIANKYISQCARYTKEQLKQALVDCAEADEAIKTGRMQDVLSVELVVIKYSCGV